MFKSLSPNLMVEDINQTIDYYINNFEAKVVYLVPETGTPDWAMVSVGSVNLMFQTRDSISRDWPEFTDKNPGGTLGFYIQVNSVRDMYENLKDRVQVVQGLARTFYGATEFTIVDINGYILTFAQDEA